MKQLELHQIITQTEINKYNLETKERNGNIQMYENDTHLYWVKEYFDEDVKQIIGWGRKK